MYCCVGTCTTNPNKNKQRNIEQNEALENAAGTVCACAADWDVANDESPDIPPHNADPEHEEEVVQPPQFPFTPAGMTGFRDAEPNLQNEESNEHQTNFGNKEQKLKERDFGSAEAYFGTATEDPIDGLLIKTAHTAPKSRCSSESCDDPSCPSSQNFCQAFMEWLEQRFGDEQAVVYAANLRKWRSHDIRSSGKTIK